MGEGGGEELAHELAVVTREEVDVGVLAYSRLCARTEDAMLRLLQRLVASDRAMRVVGALAGPYDLWSPAARRDPYPTWERIRARAPLVRLRLLGAWVATRHADVQRVLREPAFTTNRDDLPLMSLFHRAARSAPAFRNLVEHNLLMIDGKRHARLRGLVSRAFTPRRVERVLRFEPPIQLTDRAVAAPVALGGVDLRPGTLVVAGIAAAGRDPERWDHPERFDVARGDAGHLAFGLGNHVCLGASLARLEARIALGAFLRRFPDFAGAADPPDWKRSIVLRGPTALPLRLA